MQKEDSRTPNLNLVRNNKLLKDLEDKDFQELSRLLQPEIWPKNTCARPCSPRKFYFIQSGRIKVYRVDQHSGREVTLFVLKADDAFDLLSLLDPVGHQVYYETIDQAVLFSMEMTQMRLWLLRCSQINKNLLPYLGQRMKALENQASDMALADISTRLARLILEYLNVHSNRMDLIKDFPDEELAKLIGSTRAVVNRHLQEFKQLGIIERERHQVEVKNLTLLLKKARVANGSEELRSKL